MKKYLLLFAATILTTVSYGQLASRLLNAQADPPQNFNPSNVLYVDNTPGAMNRIWSVRTDAMRFNFGQVRGILDSVGIYSDARYRAITWVPTWAQVSGKPSFSAVATSGSYNDLTNQPSIPTNNNQLSNGAGYLTSFTEVDPTVSAYAKSLSSFAVIKSSTDLLYKPISYTPTKSDVGLGNVLNVDQTNPANIVQSSSYRFVSDAEKASWSGKQDALGYVPVTPTQLTTGLATKENTVTAGTTSQYYRGDKTWQTLPTSIQVYVSAVTVGQSRAQLNTSYPTANIGDMVLAPSITLGGAIYVKSSTTGGGTWQIISAPPVL